MPVVEIHLIEGYSVDERERLARVVTDAVRLVVPAPPNLITVITHEAGPGNYVRGGIARKPAPALPDACAVVRDFLDMVSQSDLDGAREMLGENFVMRFPGSVQMTRLEEAVEWSGTRYAEISKSYDHDEIVAGADAAVVYLHGTQSGRWADGATFDGVRFIERFEVTNGRITLQEVWNDTTETTGTL